MIAVNCILQHPHNSFHCFGQGLGLVSLASVDLFMRDEHLFLVGRFYDMALGSNSYIVIFSEVFSNQSHSRHFVYDLTDVEGFSRHGFDDVVVVGLKIFDVVAGNAVFYKIVVSFYAEFRTVTAINSPLKVKNRRHFLLLTVIVKYSFLLLKRKQPWRLLAEPTFVEIENR